MIGGPGLFGNKFCSEIITKRLEVTQYDANGGEAQHYVQI